MTGAPVTSLFGQHRLNVIAKRPAKAVTGVRHRHLRGRNFLLPQYCPDHCCAVGDRHDRAVFNDCDLSVIARQCNRTIGQSDGSVTVESFDHDSMYGFATVQLQFRRQQAE